MSIMQKLFGVNTPAQAASTAQPNNMQALQTGVAPEGQPVAKPDDPSKSPLDTFAKVWDTSNTALPGTTPVDFGADPAKMMEAASKIDFTKVIKPEQLAAINAGGQEATTALVSVLQAMQTQTYAQGTYAATKIAEAAVAKAQENFQAQLPALLKKHGVGERLAEENPALSHPAIQPMIEAMQTQFAAQNPNASAGELAKMTKDYLATVGKVFGAPEAQAAAAVAAAKKKSSPNQQDWSRFLTQ